MSVPQQKPAAPPRRVDADTWTMFGLAVAVLWMYLPPSLLTGKVLYGYDAFILHVRRLEFARQYLFASSPSLPAWYPREFLGTPFWSNLQNFPLIPTRLPLLLVDPWSAHGVGTNIAAVLAALFTYLLARRLGLGRTGAAVAGWTFACCGYFASRVMAGHLPLLEAYPALPLLLWLIERYAASDSPRTLRLNLLALGLSTGFVMLAGHPQLPIYAVGTAFLYLVIRAFGRKALVGAVAMIAGVGCMSFVLYPMFRLVGRSTRVLKLGPPSNDVYFPFERLKAFVLPWKDARPETYAYWDTGCYVGLLPLAAAAFVAIRWAVTRRRPDGMWLFLAVLGALALLLAFPRPWSTGGGLTILRSPARQLYLTVFALALAGGVSIDLLLRLRERLSGRAALLAGAAAVFLVAAHAVDIRLNIGPFVESIDAPDDLGVAPALAQAVGDGRIAMDCEEVDPNNRRLDDVGVYDSILLAKPYRAMLALSGMPAETNMQFISGPDLSPRALAWGGTRMVVTRRKDLSLPVVTRGEFLNVYTVSNALPRAGFIPSTSVVRADEESVLWDFRAGAAPSPGRIFLPPDQSQPATVPATLPVPAATSVVYRRPHPDRIEVDVTAPADGYVRILETFDAGWSATVDGAPAEIVLADAFVSAVRVSPGFHELRLTYHTPGVGTGIGLTIAAAAALAALIASAPRLLRPQSWQ